MQGIAQTVVSAVAKFLLNLLWTLLTGLFSYLPDADVNSVPTGATAALIQVFSWLKTWSVIVPWDAPLGGIRLLLIVTAVVYGAIGVWLLVNLIANRVWGHH